MLVEMRSGMEILSRKFRSYLSRKKTFQSLESWKVARRAKWLGIEAISRANISRLMRSSRVESVGSQKKFQLVNPLSFHHQN